MALGFLADFYDHYLCQRLSAVPRPAAYRQTDPAQTRRHAAGVEHLHGVLPVRPAPGLLLLPYDQHAAQAAAATHGAWRGPGHPDRGAAAVRARLPGDPHLRRGARLVAAARLQPDGRHALAVVQHHRHPVLRRLDQRFAVDEMVHLQRPPHGEGSVFPLLGRQHRQPPVALVLPGRGGTEFSAAIAVVHLVRRLCVHGGVRSYLCLHDLQGGAAR